MARNLFEGSNVRQLEQQIFRYNDANAEKEAFIPEAQFQTASEGSSEGNQELIAQLQAKMNAQNSEKPADNHAENAYANPSQNSNVWEGDPGDGTDFIPVIDLPIEDQAAMPTYDIFDRPTSTPASAPRQQVVAHQSWRDHWKVFHHRPRHGRGDWRDVPHRTQREALPRRDSRGEEFPSRQGWQPDKRHTTTPHHRRQRDNIRQRHRAGKGDDWSGIHNRRQRVDYQ